MKKNWDVKKLRDVMIIERGGSPRPIEKYLTNSPNGINWVKISDATASDKYIYETKEKITREGLHKTRFVNDGDFILSNSMSFGRPYIMKTTGCIHDGWLVLRDKNEIKLNKDFLYYLLSSPYVFQQFNSLAAGSTVRNLNIALVGSVKIPIPSPYEQQRIVAILEGVFAAVAQAKENAKKNLQNAIELFKSTKNNIFKNLEGVDVKVPLASVCNEIFAGGDAPKDNFSNEKTEKYRIPIIANAVKDNGLYGFTNFSRVNEPSITIAARGSGTGHVEIRYEPFFPIVRLIVLTPNTNIITLEFLKFSIQNLDILSSGSAIPQLTIPMIKEYSIPLLSIPKQHTIVAKLEALSVKTKNLETIYQQKLNDLEELKKSILQKAFNGELPGAHV